MTGKKDIDCECGSDFEGGCCKVESVVSIDDRGQMVLPKDLRQRAGIEAGDKLAIVSFQKEGKVCCITLIKAAEMEDMVKDLLGPVLKDMI